MSYDQFWRRYLGAHADPRTRALHYAGTGLALLVLAAALLARQWLWLPLALVAGYGPAWLGHYVFERNRPETFGHPVWALVSDFRMLLLFLAGRLGGELRRAGRGGG